MKEVHHIGGASHRILHTIIDLSNLISSVSILPLSLFAWIDTDFRTCPQTPNFELISRHDSEGNLGLMLNTVEAR